MAKKTAPTDPAQIKRLTVELDADTHKRARVQAAREGVPISVVLRRLLNGWLKSSEK